jgi:hypothetical protein
VAPARCRGQFFVGDGTSADPSAAAAAGLAAFADFLTASRRLL